MTVLVVADHNNKVLSPAISHTLCAAQQLGASVHVLVAGYNAEDVVNAVASIKGVDKVLYANAPLWEHMLAEDLAKQVLSTGKNYSHIVFPATADGKSIAPRVAAKLDVSQISEATRIIDANTFERFIYAGNALATVQSTDAIKVITVRASAFAAAETGDYKAEVENIDSIEAVGKSAFIRRDIIKTARPDLTSARVVIGGGKAFGSKEKFEGLLFPLADKLGAALGATRSAIDAGYSPNDWQLGQTGKVVAPELYIAVGISGAIQHTSGIKDSKIIVAINNNPDAPIFEIADYGIVGDLFEILPELTKALP